MVTLEDQPPFGALGAPAISRLVWTIADAPMFSAALRRRLRKRAARLAPGPFDAALGSMRFRLYPGENYCDRVIWSRRRLPEPAEHRALERHIRPGITFVDIGANIGTFSLHAALRSADSARVLAIEPHPRTFRKLAFNIAANGFGGIEAVQVAVGPERGRLELWSDGGSNVGHSSLEKAGTSNPKVSVEVSCVPLAELVAERGIDRIDLMKIDVEGFEDRALMPFFRAAPRSLWPAALLIEVVHRPVWKEDCLAFLAEHGYGTEFATADNLLLARGG